MKLKFGEPIVADGWRIDKRVTYDIKPEDVIVAVTNRFINAYILQRALRRLDIDVSYRQTLAVQTIVYALMPRQPSKKLVLRRELNFIDG